MYMREKRRSKGNWMGKGKYNYMRRFRIIRNIRADCKVDRRIIQL